MKKINKTKQKTTKNGGVKTDVSTSTGLTPIQEQTAVLLAMGESVTAVANKLKINRGTIYKWQKHITFKCFFNKQCADNRSTLINGLFGLTEEVLQTIKNCLQSQNEQTRLKVAIWITERIDSIAIGETDIKEVIKAECTHESWKINDGHFDLKEYKARLEELGITDDD